MSFLSSIKMHSNKLNSLAKAMDEKVEEYVNEALDKIIEYDDEFFTRGGNEEVDKIDMKETLKKLFSLFDIQPKKKSINGYIFFTKENRQDCSQRNPGLSPTQITSALSNEWKALEQSERDEWNLRAKSVAPQTEEEKRAKRSSSVSAKASKKPSTSTSKKTEKVTCEYSGCDKVVKNITKHSDGCIYCATHFKKVVVEEKKIQIPKTPMMNSLKELTVESSKSDKFNFKGEKPVDISKNIEWWKCKGLMLEGEKHRYHVQTGLILHLKNAILMGTYINGKVTKLDGLKDEVKVWCKKSNITVEEDDEDIDEELESEDDE